MILASYDVYIGETLRWDAATVRFQISGAIAYLEVTHRPNRTTAAERVAIYRSKDGFEITELERTRGRVVFQISGGPSELEAFTVTAQRNPKSGGCGCGGRKATALVSS